MPVFQYKREVRVQDFASMTPEEKNVEMWRIKKLVKTLENAKGQEVYR